MRVNWSLRPTTRSSSASRGHSPATVLTCSESEFEPRSAFHHHKPSAKSFSLFLINPVLQEGNGVFLADLSQSHASRFPRFSTLSCAFFSTSCGRAKRQVRNIIPLQIKGLSSYWGRHFFRASVGRSPIREKERFSGSSNDGCTKRRLPPKHDVKATTGGERGDAD